MSIAFYHGNEEWILKGLGVDLHKAFASLYPDYPSQRIESFTAHVANTNFHFYVQQGQLASFVRKNGTGVLNKSICLFTHFDKDQFPLKILNNCHSILFMASSQLSVAVANGLDPSRAFVCPIGVDQSLHRFIPDTNLTALCASNQALSSIKPRSCVGFVARYWDKPAYTQRKRYQLIMDIVKLLSSMDIPVIILGPGWENYEDRYQANNVHYFATKYKNYPVIYNLMKVFCSLSLHEGGPMPLLESMSCGVRPVVTNTGFAFDVLNDIDYINLLPTDATKSRIISDILNAYYEQSDSSALIRQAKPFTFEAAARKLYSKIT